MDDFDAHDFNFDALDNYDFDVPSSQPTQPQTQTLTTLQPERTTETPVKIKALKLDEKLLVETNGLPLLKNESKHLKFMGKGYEGQDLKKLMTYYTIWANNLFPKLKFQDFARKVGKPASDKLVRGLVSTWQEEYREKLKVRRDFMNELSGKTVGDDEGIVRQEDSSDDEEQRPLFIPYSSDTPRKEKTKKTQSKPVAKKRNTYHSDDEDSQPPRTITFSDDEDDEKNEGASVKSGREYALAILAEKRKKRKLAQQKIQQQEEEEEEEAEEEEEEEADMFKKSSTIVKPIDINMDEYYGENISLALSENELVSLNAIPEKQSEVENNEAGKTDLDSEMHDI
ncbi:replication fork protection component Swi3-domain-containing protein [Pilaira anomala]|nr:replication fork protection component Swi3-domain-containing protein [Pilaira anomala]